MLQSVADRVGPTVADLASPLALADIDGHVQLEPGPAGAAAGRRRVAARCTVSALASAPAATLLHRRLRTPHSQHRATPALAAQRTVPP